MENITGKIIVITGASSGLGEAAARHLTGLGANQLDHVDIHKTLSRPTSQAF